MWCSDLTVAWAPGSARRVGDNLRHVRYAPKNPAILFAGFALENMGVVFAFGVFDQGLCPIALMKQLLPSDGFHPFNIRIEGEVLLVDCREHFLLQRFFFRTRHAEF
jgi:hypothetical protein